ncbi:hypothetical protein M422DRAFT_52099 [Sphaerobolus stellatus SS14]|uniref:Uncharacterized protein n=1 Tax=Sphaerobolus stellatus (strain SS14) TaxID=990650 RepID=A0A0C9V9T2_SPHS4|nr:hypothetical protein M422DRAFT_52099 [Sphaerobolus stellatus SS14]
MTLLTVVTEEGRMTPGAALLSANVKKKTIKEWLKETKKKLMEHAKKIVKVTALITFTGDNGRVVGGPPIPYGLKYHIIYLFQEFQRVRTPEEVPAYKAWFYAHLEHACMAGEVVDAPMSEDEFEEWIGNSKRRGEDYMDLVPAKGVIIDDGGGEEVMSVSSASAEAGNQAPSVVKFMNKNWFADWWLSHVTDISLPPSITCNGSYNTNNWTESTWLTFNKIILNMHANKWIDRLLLLICAYFFPMYEQWPPEVKCIPREIE